MYGIEFVSYVIRCPCKYDEFPLFHLALLLKNVIILIKSCIER